MLAQLADKLREKGSHEARTEIARRLLAKGLSNEDVAEITGLPVETVAALRHR